MTTMVPLIYACTDPIAILGHVNSIIEENRECLIVDYLYSLYSSLYSQIQEVYLVMTSKSDDYFKKLTKNIK